MSKDHNEKHLKIYSTSMQSINDFFEMLYEVLIDSLPGILISRTGAFVWRGYRIDEYKHLAQSQYFVQFSWENPNILVFKESFRYKGKYLNPFSEPLDLSKSEFFELPLDQQKSIISTFILAATDKALRWQSSDGRNESGKVPKQFLEGSRSLPRNPKSKRHPYSQIPLSFDHAISSQNCTSSEHLGQN